MKRNPFCFGEVVTGEHFTNRINEIKRLTLELGGGNNIFLISPRRYGKTSLIMNVLGHLKTEGFLTFYLDLYKVASLRELLEAYSKGVARSCATKVERFSGFVKEFFPRLRPKVIIGTDGVPSIEIDIQLKERELMESLEEVLDIPEQIAIKRKKPFVVAFDEFQEILNLDGERIEKMMRACFQHHHHVAYVFAGSKRHLLNSMVSDPNRAFYKLGDIMNLKRIEPSEMIEFLRKQFVKGSVKVSDEVLEYILEVSEDVPYNVQYFCHHLWNWSLETKRVEEEDVEEIMDNIIAELCIKDCFLRPSVNLGTNQHSRKILSRKMPLALPVKKKNLWLCLRKRISLMLMGKRFPLTMFFLGSGSRRRWCPLFHKLFLDGLAKGITTF
ncbi:MAG: ATP-binding protein [Deltaproteobacteria bacterium]|nr:ATP-binding protein [Deltaproteobacteria bacterium]